MPRRTEQRLEALERHARSVDAELVVIDCQGQPTATQTDEWEAAAKAGRRLFIAGPWMDWGWMPGVGVPRPWEPLT